MAGFERGEEEGETQTYTHAHLLWPEIVGKKEKPQIHESLLYFQA